MSGGGGADSSWKAWLTTSREFVKEARYDLMVAEVLLRDERFKLDKCRDDEDTFYFGRRALYMLQQAFEKAAKAYLIAFRVSLEGFSYLASLHPEIKFRVENAEKVLDELKRKLDPFYISHEPHKTLIEIMKEFINPKTREAIALYFEAISDAILSHKVPAQNTRVESMLEAAKELVSAYFRSKAVAFREAKLGDLKLLKDIPEEPPCIDPDLLSTLKKLKSVKLKEIADEKLEEALREESEHLKAVVTSLAKVVATIRGMGEDLVEHWMASLLGKAEDIFRGVFMLLYLGPFIVYLGPCLHWYEQGGRYPSLKVEKQAFAVREKREGICEDLKNVGQLVEEMRYIVKEVETFVEAFETLLSKFSTLGPVWRVV